MSESSMVSIIMPVFNKEHYLRDAIDSILNQSYANIELILINDGSTDNSIEIINMYSDKRIVKIDRENKGLIYSLNEGIKISRGRFIARMDADDIALPNRISLQLNTLIKNNSDLCGCSYIDIDESGIEIGRFKATSNHTLNFIRILNENPTAGGSILVRKEFLEKKNLLFGHSLNLCEDLYMIFKVMDLGGRVTNTEDYLYLHRNVKNSLSKSSLFNDNCHKAYIEINKRFSKLAVEEIRNFLGEYSLDELGKEIICLFLIYNIRSVLFTRDFKLIFHKTLNGIRLRVFLRVIKTWIAKKLL